MRKQQEWSGRDRGYDEMGYVFAWSAVRTSLIARVVQNLQSRIRESSVSQAEDKKNKCDGDKMLHCLLSDKDAPTHRETRRTTMPNVQ